MRRRGWWRCWRSWWGRFGSGAAGADHRAWDSAFGREEIMAWCEAQKPVVYYCLGLGPNSRLVAMIQDALATARARRCLTGAPSCRSSGPGVSDTPELEPVPPGGGQGRGDERWRQSRFIVTNLPREGFRAKTGSASVRRGCMRSFTVREGTWRTNSSNRCWICRPIG